MCISNGKDDDEFSINSKWFKSLKFQSSRNLGLFSGHKKLVKKW